MFLPPSSPSAAAAQQPQPQPQPAGANSAGDMQAQWTEYYRQLGYAYYGQGGQPGAQGPPAGGGPDHKVWGQYTVCCVTVRCSGTLSASVLLADVIKTTCGAAWQAIVRGNICVNSSAVPDQAY